MNDWQAWLLQHESLVRLGSFSLVFAVMALWETLAPCRQLGLSRARRWINNLSIVVFNTLLLRIVFPIAATGLAMWSADQGWGVLNIIKINAVLAVIVSVVIMDMVIYLQHVLVHAVPLFWRLHRVHHADLDYDVTTGIRFHPLEIMLSMLIKFATISLLGPPVIAVVLFEVILNATAMFNHANIQLPSALERWLRWLVVTPDMHRVHHSVEDDETNSNFGFNLPWWDHIFGTYREQPRQGHQNMQIGLRTFRRAEETVGLGRMLVLPLVGKISGYTINRRTHTKN